MLKGSTVYGRHPVSMAYMFTPLRGWVEEEREVKRWREVGREERGRGGGRRKGERNEEVEGGDR